MKNLYFLILICLTAGGCNEQNSDAETKNKNLVPPTVNTHDAIQSYLYRVDGTSKSDETIDINSVKTISLQSEKMLAVVKELAIFNLSQKKEELTIEQDIIEYRYGTLNRDSLMSIQDYSLKETLNRVKVIEQQITQLQHEIDSLRVAQPTEDGTTGYYVLAVVNITMKDRHTPYFIDTLPFIVTNEGKVMEYLRHGTAVQN